MTIFRFSGLALLILAGCRGDDAAGDARRLGLAFCRAMEANEEKSAEALMAPALQAAIGRVRAADAAFRKATPGDKPPLGDGLPLRGFPDAIDDCTPLVETPTRVRLAYTAGSKPAWQDRIELQRTTDGRLVVADIVYGRGGSQRFSGWLAANGGGA